MSTTPDYVVIRAAAGFPANAMPPGFDGRWMNLADMGPTTSVDEKSPAVEKSSSPSLSAYPSGRFEVREDGAVAEVWELDFYRG